MYRLLTLMLFTVALSAADVLTGFRLTPTRYEGPGEWTNSVEPVWVYAYPTLRLTYRASGLPRGGAAPVLTLRPGSVGPVTPGATNIENPFVAGMPVVAVSASDLVADGALHTLVVDLALKMRTPQIDQLRFAVPAGARISIEDLEFRASAALLPCGSGGPPLPTDAQSLQIDAESRCAGAPATSLRGKESIRITGNGRRGATLYLSLYAHFASVGMFAAGQPIEKTRITESRQAAEFVARLRYTDGYEEEQFPVCLRDKRHVLVNGQAAIYALALDPNRTLLLAELLDRSLHSQIILFAAGLSAKPMPSAAEDMPSAVLRPGGAPRPPQISAVPGYRTSVAPDQVRAELTEASGGRLSLAVTNISARSQRFTLTFPSVTIQPSTGQEDVYYVFPRQGAIISRADAQFQAAYNAAFPLQFVDVFAPGANSGAVVVVLDNRGYPKKFRLRKKGAAVEVEVDYQVELEPGETYRPPPVQLTPHGGDWHEGFAVYRKWVASWYRPAGPRPVWLRTAFWARRDYPVGGTGLLFDVRRGQYTYDALIRDGERFGGIDFIDISGWALSEKSGRVGDYPVELGGTRDLRANAELGLKRGIATGLYFEGYLIDKNSAVGRGHANDWQLINAQGKGAWWSGADPRELFVCPYARGWQEYLSRRVAEVATDTAARAVYLDEFGFGGKFCYSTAHGHRRGEETLLGEIEVTREVRRALDAAGQRDTMIYIEETPPDAAAPYFDAAFCYNLDHANLDVSPLKLNLSRFVFPDIRLWDMVSTGIDPRVLSADDIRLSLWHGNGMWLKGHSETWYGADLLEFIRRAHRWLKKHAAAFGGTADPMVESPHPAVFVNRFRGGGETVYTVFNASYRTVRFTFLGRERLLGPRDVDVIADADR